MDREELLRRYAADERDFSEFNLRHINLSGADLSDINLSWADLTGADLTGADLSRTVLIETNLNGADLTNTVIEDALFCRTIMPYGTIKSDSTRVITTQQLLERYATGERRFPGLVIVRAELRNQNLQGINLSYRDIKQRLKFRPHLPKANLSGANLEGSFLRGTNFKDGNLSTTNLFEANLEGVNFTNVNLRGANLLKANLEGVDFTRADLTGARIEQHSLYWLTTFENTILPNGEIIVEHIFYSD